MNDIENIKKIKDAVKNMEFNDATTENQKKYAEHLKFMFLETLNDHIDMCEPEDNNFEELCWDVLGIANCYNIEDAIKYTTGDNRHISNRIKRLKIFCNR